MLKLREVAPYKWIEYLIRPGILHQVGVAEPILHV
jgi:hypothetical protein